MDLFSPSHLLIIAVVAVILFVGVKRLPTLVRGARRSLRLTRDELTRRDVHEPTTTKD